MIIKKLPPPSQHGRGSFENSIRYALAGDHKLQDKRLIDVPEGFTLRGEVLSHGGIIAMETAAIEMNALAALSTRCKDPVFHAVISYHPDEAPSDEEQCSDVTEMLGNLKMQECQYIAIRHRDTRHQHIHVIVNRVRADGRAAPLAHDWTALEQTHVQIAARRGWTLVEGPRNRQLVAKLIAENPSLRRHVEDQVSKHFTRSGAVKLEVLIEDHVRQALARAKTWQQFRADLARNGIAVERTEKIGQGRQRGQVFYGIRFKDREGRMCKGSQVGAKYATLIDLFGPWAEFNTPIKDHDPGKRHANDNRKCLRDIDRAAAYRAYRQAIKATNSIIREETKQTYVEIRLLRNQLHAHRRQQFRVKAQRRRRDDRTLRYSSIPLTSLVLDWLIDLVSDALNNKGVRIEGEIASRIASIRPFEKPLNFHSWLREQNGHGGPWRAPKAPNRPAQTAAPKPKHPKTRRSTGYERD